MEEFPGDLEGDEGFAGAGGEGEEDAVLVVGDGVEDFFDGDVLVVAGEEITAAVFEGDGGEAVAPEVFVGEGFLPEFVGGGEAQWPGDFAFLAGFHVDGVEALAVGGVGEAELEFAGVVLGLGSAFGEELVPGFGFEDGEFGVFVFEDVIGDEGFAAATAGAFDAALGDFVFAADA